MVWTTAFRSDQVAGLSTARLFRIRARSVNRRIPWRVFVVVAASALLVSACDQTRTTPPATPTPSAAPESTPIPEPTPTATPMTTAEPAPTPATPPAPAAGLGGQPLQVQVFSIEDYATEVENDGSRIRRGRGLESAIVSFPPGESFYVRFRVPLNLGIVEIVWSSVDASLGETTSGNGQEASSRSESTASGTARIIMDEGDMEIGPIKTAIALQINSSDTASRWTLQFIRAQR